MGGGTALCFAAAGYDVRLYGRVDRSIAEGVANIEKALQELIKHGLIPASEGPAILGRIQTTTDLAAAARGADLVIESIREDLETKRGIFRHLDRLCPPHTIFATNTSSLSPTAIAEAVSAARKPHFVALHLFNPPHLMQLVEVVAGAQTSPETMDTSMAVVKKIGKDPVRLDREIQGYIVNRVQAAMWHSAYILLEKEMRAETIDAAITQTLGPRLMGTGILDSPDFVGGREADIANTVQGAMRRAAQEIFDKKIASARDINQGVALTLGLRLRVTGPVVSADLTGLDVVKAILESLGYNIPKPLAAAVAEGRLGSKSGAGIYAHTAEGWDDVKGRRVAGLVEHLKMAVGMAPVLPSARRAGKAREAAAGVPGDPAAGQA